MAKALVLLVAFWLFVCFTVFARQQFIDDTVPGLEYDACAFCSCDCDCGEVAE